jgi:hypothetical protein
MDLFTPESLVSEIGMEREMSDQLAVEFQDPDIEGRY